MPADGRRKPGGRIAGIDGCPAGWFVATANPGLDDIRCFVAGTIAEACERLGACAAIGVDMPIGLPDAGSRACDMLARKLLAPHRAVSVFSAPIRPVLASREYREACAIRESIDGKRMSRQAFNLVSKTREIDGFVRSTPGFTGRLFEVHPELSFAMLNGGKAIRIPKRRPEGLAERYALLCARFGSEALDDALTTWPRSRVARDDVLDAFAALATVQRVAAGEAQRVPAAPESDRLGLDMAIWY